MGVGGLNEAQEYPVDPGMLPISPVMGDAANGDEEEGSLRRRVGEWGKEGIKRGIWERGWFVIVRREEVLSSLV